MKLINSTNNECHDISALGAICGMRGDSVVFDEQDLIDLLKLSPIHLRDRLTQIRVRVKQTDMLNKSIDGVEVGNITGAITPERRKEIHKKIDEAILRRNGGCFNPENTKKVSAFIHEPL